MLIKQKLGHFGNWLTATKVSKSFIQRLIRRYQNTGEVTAKPHTGGAMAKITVDDLQVLQQLGEEQPDAILSELCQRLAIA